jgi:hypothetical protein
LSARVFSIERFVMEMFSTLELQTATQATNNICMYFKAA